MKHNTDYKFGDKISSIEDFFEALGHDYSIGVVELRTLDNKNDGYQLTVYSNGDGPNVEYNPRTLGDCLQIVMSRVDFMYHLAKRGYLIIEA